MYLYMLQIFAWTYALIIICLRFCQGDGSVIMGQGTNARRLYACFIYCCDDVFDIYRIL